MDHREIHRLPASNIEIEIRPLSTIEVNHCYADALDHFPRKAQEMVAKIHTRIMTSDDEFPDDVEISDIQLYYDEVCYQMFAISTGMLVQNVRRLPYGDNIKEFVNRILRISGVDKEQAENDIDWFITNSDGLVLAHLIAKFGVPLTDKAWKLTSLQYRFLTRDNEESVYEPKTTEDIVNVFKAMGRFAKVKHSTETGRSTGAYNSSRQSEGQIDE